MADLRLNIGAGECELPGYLNIDRRTGQEAFPLEIEAGSCTEIRASHILEHFPHGRIPEVLADWVNKLQPGGLLKIAVPDFAVIAKAYLSGAQAPIEGYVMGGQTDENDFHRSLFDEESLTELMRAAGLIGISRWNDSAEDCSRLQVSLNLQGIKPTGKNLLGKVCAVMSVPRLGFQDNMFCAIGILPKYGISLVKTTGAFWGQCLTRAMNEAIEAGADWILTLDYDTVFTGAHIEMLLSLASRYPEADAIVPIQSHRSEPTPLMTIKDKDGRPMSTIGAEMFAPELIKVSTAHFGLTLIRVESLKKLSKPWFMGLPGTDGSWGDDRVDDDIYFWKEWERSGFTLYQANRIAIGHLEMMIRWPGRDLAAIHQHPNEFHKTGVPEDVWR